MLHYWTVKFYQGVEKDIREMPIGIRSRMVKLLEVIQIKGPDLGEPLTKPLGKGLFEIRAKAAEGIGRSLFCYQQGKTIVILYAFVKKHRRHPKQYWILQGGVRRRLNMEMMTLDELKNELMQDADFKREYEALEEEFKLIEALVDMRQKAGLTQEDIAKKMGTQKSNISRLESGSGNPGWKTLQKYAHACGFKIQLQYTH